MLISLCYWATRSRRFFLAAALILSPGANAAYLNLGGGFSSQSPTASAPGIVYEGSSALGWAANLGMGFSLFPVLSIGSGISLFRKAYDFAADPTFSSGSYQFYGTSFTALRVPLLIEVTPFSLLTFYGGLYGSYGISLVEKVSYGQIEDGTAEAQAEALQMATTHRSFADEGIKRWEVGATAGKRILPPFKLSGFTPFVDGIYSQSLTDSAALAGASLKFSEWRFLLGLQICGAK